MHGYTGALIASMNAYEMLRFLGLLMNHMQRCESLRARRFS